MAKLKGMLPIEGTVGGITFAKTQDGIIVKTKSAVAAARIAKAPGYERTRENNREFALASKAGKSLRNAFERSMFIEPDGSWANRLTGRLLRVIQSDNEGRRGSRTIKPIHLHILQGYEFNDISRLADSLFLKPELNYDAVTGKLSAVFADFRPDCVINAPDKTTHFRIALCGVLFDAAEYHTEAFQSDTAMISFEHKPVNGLSIEVALPNTSGRQLLVALGIEYYKLIRSIHSPLEDGKRNTAAIVGIW